jgi:hypothetical protein
MTTRRRAAELSSLFTSFDLRGKAAIHWLRHPRSPVGGVMIFTTVGTRRVSGVGAHRVRPAKAPRSTKQRPEGRDRTPMPSPTPSSAVGDSI